MTNQATQPSALSTSKVIRFSELEDIGSTNRVQYYCAAIKAANIGNHSAAAYFNNRAQRWERVRVKARSVLSSGSNPTKEPA